MSKNIVVCCDGTANKYGERNTNVVKLFSSLNKEPSNQIVYYDPGVGTFSPKPVLTTVSEGFWKLLGLGFGLGLTVNIIDAYKFLMKTYEDGDHVYLFGFSRGAYTVRALAAMLHKCGLLQKNSDNLVPYMVNIFKKNTRPQVYNKFKKTFSRSCPIHFLGIWDTVTTIGRIWNPQRLPFTTKNPILSHIRHAVSLDERRGFYRQNLMQKASDGQDLKQVWFAGVHSDVGGGYPVGRDGLSKLALEWMLVEANNQGLLIDKSKALPLVRLDETLSNEEFSVNKSLNWKWWWAELYPKLVYDFKKGRRRPHLNLGRRRRRPNNALIHATVFKLKGYKSSALPQDSVEPWNRLGDVFSTSDTEY